MKVTCEPSYLATALGNARRAVLLDTRRARRLELQHLLQSRWSKIKRAETMVQIVPAQEVIRPMEMAQAIPAVLILLAFAQVLKALR